MVISPSAVGGPGDAAIVTSDRFATEAGAEVLRDGGTAIDALVTAAAVQCVVENGSTTVAGMWVSANHDAASGVTTSVSGKIGPAAAEPYDYAQEGPAAYGGRAMPVPGWPAGAFRAWEDAGRTDWARLLEPAIALAEDGFALDPASHHRVKSSLLAARTEEGRRLWMRDGRYLSVGDRVLQPELARTLRDLADGGPAAFYEGDFGRHYVETARARGGALTTDDLRGWTNRAVVEPVAPVGDYRGYGILAEGALLVYGLQLAQAARIETLDAASAAYAEVRILEEVFAATTEYSAETHDRFVDPAYAAARIDDVLGGPPRPTSAGQFLSNTNTLVARDHDGNVAWLTHSINTPTTYGAGILVDGAYAVRAIGPVHARAGDVLAPGLFTQIALYRDGRPRAIASSPGHSCVHAPLAFLIGLLQRGLDPVAAIAAPRFALPGATTGGRQPFEAHFAPEVFALLEERGLPVFETAPAAMFGRVTALVLGDDRVHGVSDPRDDGVAAVIPRAGNTP